MTRVLVLYYSSYGHIETMAQAIAEGAALVPGTEVTMKRVPELMPQEVAETAGVKLDQTAEIADPQELADYDAIIFGTPTRFGNMAAQMRNFLDQTGGLWARRALVGKVGSVFASTASQHGGQEGVPVGGLLDDHGRGFARTVAGLGLDADQGRQVARVGRLQPGRVLEAVPGHHAVVVIGGGDHDRGVFDPVLQVVVGGILGQCREEFRVVSAAVLIDPETAGGESVESQHVHHTHARQTGTE